MSDPIDEVRKGFSEATPFRAQYNVAAEIVLLRRELKRRDEGPS